MIDLTENGHRALTTQYCLRDDKGNPYESPEMIYNRLADGLCGGDSRFRDRLHAVMTAHRFYPNTSCFFNLGNRINQLAVCLVLPVEDDLDNILDTARIMGLAQRAGFGTGIDLSPLRPEMDIINSTKAKSCGPLGFLKVYDAIGGIIKHGYWRGAYLAALKDSHPDVFKWIAAKEDEFAYPNFNTAVTLSDRFMDAAMHGNDWDLIFNGKVYKTINAADLLDGIARYIWLNGGLGVLFSAAMNRGNSCPHLYDIAVTNPCGEQPVGPWESCCLGYNNILAHTTADGIDWELLQETVTIGTRCLDNIITTNNFVPSVPQIKAAALLTRRIGNGPTGLADTFFKLGLPYGSKESVKLAGDIMEAILFFTMSESIKLARERGPFPAILGSNFGPYTMKWRVPRVGGFFDWEKIEWGIKRYGIRNAAFTSVAPSQLSVVMGLEGYGCEPLFSLSYRRQTENEQDYVFESAFFEDALVAAKLESSEVKEAMAHVKAIGSCQNAPHMSEEIKTLFRVSDEIPPEEHLDIQAALQKSASGGVSKTINAAENLTIAQVRGLIIEAWRKNIKGFTIYRRDSRSKAVCVNGICEV